jgi:hypothetical protein
VNCIALTEVCERRSVLQNWDNVRNISVYRSGILEQCEIKSVLQNQDNVRNCSVQKWYS